MRSQFLAILIVLALATTFIRWPNPASTDHARTACLQRPENPIDIPWGG